MITAKGEVDKEIYAIERLQADPDEKKEARLALHFDLTVPLARYVAQHFNDLTFPFKRYQMQRVWRGERPQTGRFREFYQCDIDVINVDHLPLHFDAEMPAIIWEVLNGLPGMENEKIQLRISNRKILLGLLDAWNVENKIEVSRAIDKIEKIGKQDVFVDLTKLGLNLNQIELIMVLAATKGSPSEISGLLRDFIARNDVIARSESDDAIQALEEGIEELETVMKSLAHLPKGPLSPICPSCAGWIITRARSMKRSSLMKTARPTTHTVRSVPAGAMMISRAAISIKACPVSASRSAFRACSASFLMKENCRLKANHRQSF